MSDNFGKSEFGELFLDIYSGEIYIRRNIVRGLLHKNENKVVDKVRIRVHEVLEVGGIYFRGFYHGLEVFKRHIRYDGVDESVLKV